MSKQKKDVIWNALGSLVYALASMILSFLVIRLQGADDGGIFGFGFSTLGQQMFIIAYFGIRPFHITDMKNEYSFGDYLYTRRLTSGLAVLSACGFLWYMVLRQDYSVHKALILFLLCLYKIADGYADVYESELQRQGLLYRTGQSLFYRTLFSVLCLTVCLAVTRNLLLSCAVSVLMQLIGTEFFAVRILRRDTAADYHMRRGACTSLLKNTGLLFVSVFLDFYVFSASKYAVDAVRSDADNGFFNILFMPTSFIYLIANFMIRPMLTGLAEKLKEHDSRAFRTTCRRMLLGVSFLSLGILFLAAVLGRFGLSVFELLLGDAYRGSLLKEYGTFLLLILGGAFYALANVQYYILVTMRRQSWIFAGYVLSAVLAALTAVRFTERLGLYGAAVSYAILMAVLFLIFTMSAVLSLREMSAERRKP